MAHPSTTAPALLASFTAFDWLLTIILAWSTLLALVRGLLRELCSLAGLIVGLLLGSWYYGPVAVWLEHWLPSAATANITAFLLIAVGVGVMAGVLGRLFRRTASTIGLGFLDRLAGGIFGFARGCLLGTVVVLAIAAFTPSFPALRASRLAPYFLDAAHGISFIVPHDLQAQIAGGVTALKHIPPHWIKGGR